MTTALNMDTDGSDEGRRAEMPVLAVDLDGTLLRSDMLHETLWGALAVRSRHLGEAILSLFRGRAALKASLAENADIDPATLPYDQRVLDHIAAWRAKGGYVVLVTATDVRLARQVADHLGVFDAVHGSTADRNLKGAEKTALLVAEYGRQGFVYIGDSRADLAVWAEAAEAVTVGADRSVRRAVDAMGRPALHIPARGGDIRSMLRALRPHQWLKNLLVFVPIIADPAHGGWEWTWALSAFVALSLARRRVYVINDLLDLVRRPEPPAQAQQALRARRSVGRDGHAHGAGAAASGVRGRVADLGRSGRRRATYFVLTMAYSLRLKRHSIIDICTLAGLYTIRIVAGAVAIGVFLSVWLLAFSMFTFFALAAAKRLGELSDADAAGRTVTRRGYTVEDRRILSQMAISAGYVGVLVLALYIDEPAVQDRFGAHRMFWGVCALLIFWISRLVLVANRGDMDDDPLIWAMKDPVSRATVVIVAALIAGPSCCDAPGPHPALRGVRGCGGARRTSRRSG
jgi:4-hydroxybenzoate polyprenyltransferase/phosphoserine phosphatase